ncbi:olfactory receptor 9A4-like isoform X1 [Monodelphis domestica]|uniref:olfactory receptor 9A4-like isoform X1 n=1 Tax=Monodelphis domestica TaxID=13616 RepID=UPI0024E25BE9|nr:olfactory receptor 9A4-like isoform X1 [Monodelphis domestica]
MVGNHSGVIKFYIEGFSGSPEFRHTLFAIFFFSFFVTIMGNMIIIVIVCADHRLHSPMYFFLGHLSFLDILITSTIIPPMLGGLLMSELLTMSFSDCITQLFLYLSFGTTEFILVGAMAVDRYVAVCNPLRYNIIMNNQVCISVVIMAWLLGFLIEIWPVYATFQLPFCKSTFVNHFFCERGLLLKLSCEDTTFLEFILFLMAVVILFGSLLPTLISYTYIISTILKISSASGQRKAFSTCASHFTFVIIGYGTCLFLYVKPKQTQAAEYNRIVSLMISVVTPFLTPFIFTLRNDKVKEVLRDGMKHCYHLFKGQVHFPSRSLFPFGTNAIDLLQYYSV